jgi:hypothetical protein
MKSIKTIVAACLLMGAANAGPTSIERKSEFEKALNVVLASALPHSSDLQRERLIRDYIDGKPNKAQAVNLPADVPYRGSQYEDYQSTGDRVLEACQLRYGSPCALVAVNDEIVGEGRLDAKDMPLMHYSGEFDIAKIPIIRDVTKARSDLKAYPAIQGAKAIAIHPWGTLFIATRLNSRDAQDAALAECNADPRRQSRDGNCFVYAVNNEVVIEEPRQLGK